ncbi:MAG: M56 family metallopeptidase, partial [Candidatus Eremiobacteraeota bacterium]|nr:M56 family metallopeptidase [Candidatus Eremiobacteraeota bacterium]
MIQERIIVALFNATWQTIAITLLVALALRIFARTSASARCAVWTGVLILATALPFLDFTGIQSIKAPQAAKVRIQPATSAASARVRLTATSWIAAPVKTSMPAVSIEPQAVRFSLATAVRRIAQGAFYVWLAGMLVFGVRFVYAMSCLVLAKNAIEPLDTETLLRGRHMRRAVRLGVSDSVAVPCLLGFFSPVIALPRAVAIELSGADLQRVVLHESAHLERHDDWFNLLEQIALVIFFFNPAMHYIARCIGMDREIACDDHVIAKSENRLTYAECLTQLARRCNNRRALS